MTTTRRPQQQPLRALLAGTVITVAMTLGTPGVAHAAAGCDLGDLGREGTAPHGTQVSIGGKVFICHDGEWSML